MNLIDGASGRFLIPSSLHLRYDSFSPSASRRARPASDDVFRGLQRVEPQTDRVGAVLNLERFDHVVAPIVHGAGGAKERRPGSDPELFR